MSFLKRAIRRRLACVGLLFCCMLFQVPTASVAEDAFLPAEALPNGIPPLPSPRERSGGLLLISNNVDPYRDLLVQPLFDWVKKRKLVVRAVRGLDHLWKLTDAWEEAARAPAPRWVLDKNYGISKNSAAGDSPIGPAFGGKEILNSESDPKIRAAKILWNLRLMQGMTEEMKYSFEMAWSGTQIVRRRADAFLYQRFFPQLADEQPFLIQSLFRFIAPTSLQNYSLLSWIFRDETRSRFWIFSPPIQRLREVLPANRSDGILGSSLSTDDLFVWSGDVRRVQPQVLQEQTIFVFFPSLHSYPLLQQTSEVLSPEISEQPAPQATPAPSATAKPAASVSTLAVSGFRDRPFGGMSAAVLWNYDLKQYPQLAPWLPITVTAVPRRVWVIEMLPQDPYYEAGRELLYVDQEMMLPVMKLTFDRIGELKKTVLGGWGLAEKKDRSVVFPFLAFEIAVEQAEVPVTTLSTTAFRKFSGKDSAGVRLIRGLLQPEAYGKPRENQAAAAPKSAAGKPAETPAPEERALAID